MKLDLPFSDATITELCGKTIVLSDSSWNENLFRPFLTTTVKDGGDLDRAHFEVLDGILRLIDRHGLFCEFDALETKNGAVYVTGVTAQTTSSRITLHEQQLLSIGEFGICISSHVNYAKTTLPKILDSIRKAGFDMTKVVANVGGYSGEKTEEMNGVKVVYRQPNTLGFGGLIEAQGDLPYWLLLHDTCEVERTFVELFGKIDIGLHPDMVLLQPGDWMGFYSKHLLEKVHVDILEVPKRIVNTIECQASVVTILPGKVTVENTAKDIYGTGNKRFIEKIEAAGIRKFRAVSNRKEP